MHPKTVRKSKSETKDRASRSECKETDTGVRGAVVGLRLAGHTFQQIQNLTGLSRSTASSIYQHATTVAAKENQDPLADSSLIVKPHTGRPPKFSSAQRQQIVSFATSDASHRRCSFKQLARQAPFPISDVWLARILKQAGYDLHIPRAKPALSKPNQVKRLEFSMDKREKPVQGYWDGWIFTDEMHFVVGSHYGPERIIRNKEEEYHQDCVDLERPGEVRIMFWGAIIYGVACKNCPFYIWEEESKEEKEAAVEVLAEENTSAEEAVKELRQNWYEKEMARRRSLPKGKRPKGKPALPFELKVRKKKRGKNMKGGIDWFRYRENVCKPLLYPFYDEMLESWKRGERGKITLVEDGAGPHRAQAINSYHHEKGINKVDWPASSPDFNAIERVWDLIRKRIARRRPFPSSKDETKKAWIEEWKGISVETTNSYIEGLPRRMRDCVRQNGGNLFHA